MRQAVFVSGSLILLLCVFGVGWTPALAQLAGEGSEYWTRNSPGIFDALLSG